MTPLSTALSKVLPVALTVTLGQLARRRRLLTPAGVEDLKRLVVHITLPALLFTAFSRIDADARYLGLVAALFAAAALALLAGKALRPILAPGRATFPALLTGFEAGMLGYALFTAIYGQEALYRFALLDLGQALLVYFVVIPGLERAPGQRTSFAQALLGFARSPVLLAIALGLLFKALGLTVPLIANPLGAGLFDGLRLVGGLTGALVAIIVGYEIQLTFGRLSRPVLAVAARLAIWVALGLALDRFVLRGLLGLDHGFSVALAMLVVLPPPFVIPIFLRSGADDERRFAVDAIAVATLVALAGASAVAILWPGPLG